MTSAASMGTQLPHETTVAAEGTGPRSPAPNFREVTRLMRDEETNLTLLSDRALDDRIRFYDMQMQAAMQMGMKPEAHRCRQHFEAALRERNRRPHLVAAREKELGLS